MIEILLVHLVSSALAAWITYEVLSKKHRKQLWKVQMELLEEKRKRIGSDYNKLREKYTACQQWYQKGREDEKSRQSI